MITRLCIAWMLLGLVACGANCPESSNAVFPPPPADDEERFPDPNNTDSTSAPVVPGEDEGPTCGIPLGATQTDVTQQLGEPDATSEPQEVSTEYHYYGKLLIIYRMKRVEDVILQQGGQCP